jgi:chromosomal replication initiation ATPase DnaA
MLDILIDQRDPERALILGYLKNSVNTMVYGSSGIGKTTLIKSVIEEINNSFGQAIYVDCSLYPTANAVLREILLSLGSVIASKSNYELTKRLKERTRKVKLFVFLDHSEGLKSNDILNILLGLDFCICLVADHFESYRAIDFHLRTKIANTVKIEKPTNNQISEILKDSASNISDEIIQKIVEKSGNNLTLALNMVKSIEANHGRVSSLERFDFDETNRKSLSEDESVILQILKQQKKIPSGELYSLYCEGSEYPKSERSFRNYMEVLCKKRLVKSIGEKRGRFYEMIEGNKSLECLNVE